MPFRPEVHSRLIPSMLVALSLVSAGCREWHPLPMPTPQSFEAKPSARYRITTLDTRVWHFTSLSLRNDSLLGRLTNDDVPMVPGLPIAQIQSVEVRRHSTAGTFVLIGSMAAFTAILGATMPASPCGNCGFGGSR